MKNFFLERTIKIFEAGFINLSSYHNLMQNQKAVLAYSGGKDSSFLLNFYYYLFEKKRIPEPIIFHLNHQIRNNQEEEGHLKYYLIERFPLMIYCKKKTFLIFPND
ncbi:MAG: PP-loop domain protein [Leptospiraceae bacterium]|nr:PP-loop domain protein [Leptospiraceae bacterium]